MIPKIIHFIWIGNTVPQQYLNSIEQFKKLNPTFNINFVHTTIDEIQSSSLIDIAEARDAIIETINGKTNRWSIYIKKYIRWNLSFISIFTDLLRFVLLDRYGGIYLDCDTWPIKPFDELILSYKSFAVKCKLYKKRNITDNYNNIFFKKYENSKYNTINFNNSGYFLVEYFDVFFVGAEKNSWLNTITIDSNGTIFFDKQINKDLICKNELEYSYDYLSLLRQYNFYNQLNLKFDEESSYLYHLQSRYWQSNNILKKSINRSVFDYMIYPNSILLIFDFKNMSNISCLMLNIFFIKQLRHFINISIKCSSEILKYFKYCNSIFLNIDFIQDDHCIYNDIFTVSVLIPDNVLLNLEYINSIVDFTFNREEDYFSIENIVFGKRKYANSKKMEFMNSVLYTKIPTLNDTLTYSNIILISKCSIDKSNIVNVCFTVDNDYLKYCINTIDSMVKSLNYTTILNIFIISNVDSNVIKAKIIDRFQNVNCRFTCIKLDLMFFLKKSYDRVKHTTNYTYARLLLSSLLPNNIDKVLYFDSDIVIKKDIYELFSIDLNDNVIGGVEDNGFEYFHNTSNKIYDYIKPLSKYINAGVLLIDLKKIRDKKYQLDLYLTYLNNTHFCFADQDVINITLQKKILYIDKKYNLLIYVNNIKDNIPNDTVIIHNVRYPKDLLSTIEIRLITFLRNEPNYGQKLLCFALQKKLKDIYKKTFNWRNVKNINVIAYVNGASKFKILKYSLIKKYLCDLFVEKYILTKTIYSLEDIYNDEFDKIYFGGDLILNYDICCDGDQPEFYYLPKIPSSKKIVYSASMGNNISRSQILDGLSSAKIMSVRESSYIPFINNTYNINCEHTIDPVFLYDKNTWKDICVKPSFIKDIKEEFSLAIELYGNFYDNIPYKNDTRKVYHIDTFDDYPVGPSEFLWLIKHCKKLYTSSFHAYAFGLIFNVPEIKIVEIKSKNTRIAELNRLLDVKYNNCTITNYDLIMKNIILNQKHALDFLNKTLY